MRDDKRPDLDLSGLPDKPEINLDQWIIDQLPIEDPKLFFERVLKLEPNHCRGPHETTFVFGLHAAAYGNRETLGLFLSHDDYFQTLTLPKREILAWIMENPETPKNKHLNSYNTMKYFADLIANLIEVCNYSKTKAIDIAVNSFVHHPTADQSLEAADAREQRAESLKVQVRRAIKPGGLVHEYYTERLREIREYHEAMAKLRNK